MIVFIQFTYLFNVYNESHPELVVGNIKIDKIASFPHAPFSVVENVDK